MAKKEQCCGNSSVRGGGGTCSSSSKMGKVKKPPQRGLGVEQLEKMLFRERQKKAAAAPSFLLCPQQQHHHHHPTIPFPLSSLADLPPPNSILNPFVPGSGVEFLTRELPALPLPPPLFPFQDSQGGVGGFSVKWNSMDFNQDAAEAGWKFEPAFPFHPQENNSNPVWPSSGAVMKKQGQQHRQQPSSMVNIPTSPSSSSGVNLQMEPPSNQINDSNSKRLWPEEDKVVGRKRAYHFILEDLPAGGCNALFGSKFSPFSPSCPRRDESPCGRPVSKPKSCNATFRREDASGSTTIHGDDDLNFVEVIKENESLDGRFLTLGPPATPSKPKSKRAISVPSTDCSEFNSLPFQASMELPREVPGHPQPYYSVLPMWPGIHPSATSEIRAEGADGIVDLSLKL